jgi:hypothetical protein
VAQFTFTDSAPRVYPTLINNGETLYALPGQTYELDADPADGRWAAVTAPAQPVEAPQTAPDASETPATPDPSVITPETN